MYVIPRGVSLSMSGAPWGQFEYDKCLAVSVWVCMMPYGASLSLSGTPWGQFDSVFCPTGLDRNLIEY